MNSGLQHMGKLLVIVGVVFAALGALLLLSDRIPWIGRMPGDIIVRKKNFTFYFPLMTSIILSIVITLIFWLVGRR